MTRPSSSCCTGLCTRRRCGTAPVCVFVLSLKYLSSASILFRIDDEQTKTRGSIAKLTDQNDFAQPALASSGPVWTAPPASRLEGAHTTWKHARRFRSRDAPFAIVSPPTLLAASATASALRLSVDEGVEPDSVTHVRALRQEVDLSSSVIQYASDVLPDGTNKSKDENRPMIVIPFHGLQSKAQGSRTVSKCLVLRAGGLLGNQLIVGILQPSAPWRDGGAPAFANYKDYEQQQTEGGEKLTRGFLERSAAENAARARAQQGGPDLIANAFVHMVLSERVLHQFPSPICSLHLAPESGEPLRASRSHSKNWICIRTITSTVFASLRVQPRALWNADTLAFVELWGLLEIMHGESAIPSGVKGHRASRNRKWTDIHVLSSPSQIVDVTFHPHRRDAALTIDATGSLGRFECDLFKAFEHGWRHGTTWSLSLTNPASTGQRADETWTVEWDSGEENCLVGHSEGVWDVRLTDGARKVVYEPFDGAEVVSISTSPSPSPILWIATTEEVLALDLRDEFALQRLASCAHGRVRGDGLHIEAVRRYPERNVALLSSCNDGLVSTFSLQVDSRAPIASWDGEPGILQTGVLHSSSRRSSFPLLVSVDEMDEDWSRALQNSVDADRNCATFAILESTREGGLWITGACATQGATSHLPFDRQSSDAVITKDRKGRSSQSQADALTLRTVHSLSGMYKYLFSGAASDDNEEESLELVMPKLLSSASDWLRQQESASSLEQPAIVLARDVLSAMAGVQSGSSRMSFRPKPVVSREDHPESMQGLWSTHYTHLLRHRQGGEEGGAVGLLQTSLEVAKRYAVATVDGEAADEHARKEAVNRNLDSATREMMVDMALSACPLSRLTRGHADDEGLDVDPLSSSVLRLHFTPDETSSTSSKSKADRKKASVWMPITAAAHSLLEEWPLGDDPSEYQYVADGSLFGEEEPLYNGERTAPAASKQPQQQRNRSRSGAQMPLASDDYGMPPPLLVQSRLPQSDDRAYDAAASSDPFQSQSMLGSGGGGGDSYALDPSLRDAAWQSQSSLAPLASQGTAVPSSQQTSQKVRKKRRVGGF